jgi:hypothetical protein
MTNQDNSAISKELWQAFLETDFKVFSENPFTLKVGQYSDELNSIIKKSKCSSAAFITAYNPYSKQLSDAENVARQEQLKIEIAKRGLTAIEGIGQHPSNQWPGEPSLLILGLNKEAASTLARQLEQNAFVWCDETSILQLVQPSTI